MAKIPFDIKYRPQIESGEYRVENMAGFPVTILDWCYNGCQIIAKTKIKGEVEGKLKDYVRAYTQDGGLLVMGEKYDDTLCIITPEPELSDSRQKSLRNNQKQEDDWTEDDEKHLKWLCGIIRHTLVTYKELSLKEEVELGKWMDKWLNHSPNHQFHWKPSEEQMESLEIAVSALQSTTLESLYNDLKKL